MSEADAASEVSGRGDVWIEKYRPESLDDVKGHENVIPRLQEYVAQDDLPSLLFAGPAGVGKCVVGSTPIITNHGIERIDEVVDDIDGFDNPPADLQVLTFDSGGAFEYVEPAAVFSKEAAETVTVATRDGSELTVTSEHQLLVVDEGGFDWRQAADLEDGDRVARPLEAPTVSGTSEIDWLTALEPERIAVTVARSFAQEHGLEPLTLGTPRGDSPSDDQVLCSLGALHALDIDREHLDTVVDTIQYVPENGRQSKPITPVRELTPELAAFVGLAISEAQITRSRIKFYNTNEELFDRFVETARELFDVEPTIGRQHDVPFVRIDSRTLVYFLETIFDSFDAQRAEEGVSIGSTLVHADDTTRAAFLQAVFDAEAHVTDHGIVELTQKNERIVTLLSYLLSTFGIPSRRKSQQKTATNGSDDPSTYHTLYLSGQPTLERFGNEIGFSIDEKAQRLSAAVDRESNPNHDTMPVQTAATDLCEELYLSNSDLLTETLNPESPGRENYLADLDCVVDAATEQLDTAQRVREQLEQLRRDIATVSKLPATWVGKRSTLEPIEIRNEIQSSTGIRSDTLLEYADGRQTPTATRVGALLTELDLVEETPPIETVQAELEAMIDALNVPYNHLAERTGHRGTELINLLRNDDHDIRTLTRFEPLVDALYEITDEMLSERVLDEIQTLHRLAAGTLYFDEVTSVDHSEDPRRVYDLTVPGTRNYVAGTVPTLNHNTASAVAIARELYGDDWETNFLELNASDERGIDVVRGRIKDFARSSFGGYSYKIIFLDEADALTSDAQGALRRTMEQFSHSTRFILSCNYSSRIIDPIQSRCAVFRFGPLDDEAVADQIGEIAETEGIALTEDGLDALVYTADGDMRKAINALQAAAVMGEEVDEDAVYSIASTARPEEVTALAESAIEGDFLAARSQLEDLLVDKGIAGGDVIDQLHRTAWDLDVEEQAAVRLMDRIGEAEYRITAGADERIQLEALLASLALDDD